MLFSDAGPGPNCQFAPQESKVEFKCLCALFSFSISDLKLMRADREQTGKRPLVALRVNLFESPMRETRLLGASSKGCVYQLTWLARPEGSARESAGLGDGQLSRSEETSDAYWPSKSAWVVLQRPKQLLAQMWQCVNGDNAGRWGVRD